MLTENKNSKYNWIFKFENLNPKRPLRIIENTKSQRKIVAISIHYYNNSFAT